MSNARRRRERRLRSWLRHEAQSVAAARTAARHHSAGPREKVVTRREHEENDGLRAQTTPLPGARLPEDAGPQAAVTVGYVAAGAPSLAVVLVSDMMHDDATVQFLLRQSLLARAQEEEEAEEAEVLKQLEVVLAEGGG